MASGRPSAAQPLPRAGLVLLAMVTVLWGLAWPVMKVILGYMPPLTFRALVVPVSGVILLGLAAALGLTLAVPRRVAAPLALAALFNVAAWQILSGFGLVLLHAGEAALIAYTMPVWVSILSVYVLGERMRWRYVAALALGLSGVAVLRADLQAVGTAPLGSLLMLGAAVSWAAGVVLLKRVAWEMPTISLAGWQLVVGGVPIVIAAAIVDPGFPAGVPLHAWLLVVYMILGPMAFCSWGFFRVVHLLPATVSAIGTLMVPVVGVLAGAIGLGEPLGLRELAAMVLVCGGLGLALLRR